MRWREPLLPRLVPVHMARRNIETAMSPRPFAMTSPRYVKSQSLIVADLYPLSIIHHIQLRLVPSQPHPAMIKQAQPERTATLWQVNPLLPLMSTTPLVGTRQNGNSHWLLLMSKSL
jgi:hypothetical protein